MARGLDALIAMQERDGSWFGRWGMNYIYGTWSALCALAVAGVRSRTPSMRKAVDWLVKHPESRTAAGARTGDSYRLDYKG